MSDNNRGIGLTTNQIKAAKHGALFVWCNNSLQYPRSLARGLNRLDLKIIGPGDLLDPSMVRSKEWPQIVIDHAAKLSGQQHEILRSLRLQKAASPSSSEKTTS